jgi:hypothetical protein
MWFLVFVVVVVIVCVHGFLADMKVGNHGMDLSRTWQGLKCLYGFHTPKKNRTASEIHCGIEQCNECDTRWFNRH